MGVARGRRLTAVLVVFVLLFPAGAMAVVPPAPPPLIAVTLTGPARVSPEDPFTVEGTVDAASAGAPLTVEVLVDGGVAATAQAGLDGSWAAELTLPEAGTYELVAVTARGLPLETRSDGLQVTARPDPSTATSMHDAAAFLYTGPDAVQMGVEPDTIRPELTTVLRGRVIDRDGAPLPGVTVRVHDRPEYGVTETATDGEWAMAANGGERLIVDFDLDGHLPAQRHVEAPWQDWAIVDDVALITLDDRATRIDLDEPTWQAAAGSPVEDEDGSRQATVLFPASTRAEMVLPDGSRQAMDQLTFRATEYTVGDRGPAAMPGPLPDTTGYTYAVELSADEAIAAGATSVEFSSPVWLYVENFLEFPVGERVPAGSYDRDAGAWVPSRNGRVLRILDVVNGIAQVDSSGDGQADTALGVAERQQLGRRYEPGTELWRIPIPHFTPWDCNWPYGPPDDAEAPEPPVHEDPEQDKDCDQPGSVIGCQRQTLGEEIALVGSTASLHYRSDRAEGHRAAYEVPIRLTGPSVPDSARAVRLVVEVAGRRITSLHDPAPNQTTTFTWDGLDAFGREINGAQPVRVRVGYVYDLVYRDAASFAASFGRLTAREGGDGEGVGGGRRGGTVMIDAVRGRQDIAVERVWDGSVGRLTFAPSAVAGWTLSDHHAYDPGGRVLHRGDGEDRGAGGAKHGAITTIAGTGECCVDTEVPATESDAPATHAAPAPDGGVYLVIGVAVYHLPVGGRLREIWRGGPNPIRALASGPDGSVYVGESARVHRIDRDGTATVVAGNGSWYGSWWEGNRDERPATDAYIVPSALAVADDGTMYIADRQWNSIRLVTPDGIVSTLHDRVRGISSMDVGPDGSLFWTETVVPWQTATFHPRVRRMFPDGTIVTLAGDGDRWDDGVPAADADVADPRGIDVLADGTILFLDQQPGRQARLRAIEPDGTVTTFAGDGTERGDGVPAQRALLQRPTDVAATLRGIVVTDTERRQVRMIHTPLPAFDGLGLQMAAKDGSEVYRFDASGRHLATHDGLDGRMLRSFSYDEGGRLAAMDEADGRRLAIERDPSGRSTAIVAPDGRRTRVTVDNRRSLAEVAHPGGGRTTVTTSAEGLLTSYMDAGGATTRFAYDPVGRLVRHERAGGGVTTLQRDVDEDGISVTVTGPTGMTTTYHTRTDELGRVHRTVTDPAGAHTVLTVALDGTLSLTRADGTTATAAFTGDPRHGMQVPIMRRLEIQHPDGRSVVRELEREVRTDEDGDGGVAFVVRDAETVRDGGSLLRSESTYDGSARTVTTTTPAGRDTVTLLDVDGRPVEHRRPGVAPVQWEYDDLGRVREQRQGRQGVTFERDALGRVTSRTDASGAVTAYELDDADRVTATTLPSGRTYGFGYDASGQLAELVMPSGAVHALDWAGPGRLETLTAPDGAPLRVSYDEADQVTGVTLPSGRAQAVRRDPGGRLSDLSGEATTVFSYADATDRPTRSAWTPPEGTSTTLELSWAGSDVSASQVSGASTASHSFAYDGRRQLLSAALAGGSTREVQRDADGAVTAYGPVAFAPDGPDGAATTIEDGAVAHTLTYDDNGRIAGRQVHRGDALIYEATYGYDLAGRLVEVNEHRPDGTVETSYRHDVDGQLIAVERDGSTAEDYGYDVNGNRTGARIGEVSRPASFDAQDRLTRLGDVAYDTDGDGMVVRRGEDRLTYGTRGELLEVALGSGGVVRYAYDGLGRRVARTEGDLTTEYLYGDPEDDLQVTAVRVGDELTELHYDGGGRLVRLDRGGQRFSLVTDLVGTPQLVLAADGSVVADLRWSAYGERLSVTGSDPSFDLPVGFAGGIADPTTGLLRFGLRDYDPAAGRWLTRDPLLFAGQQANLYGYATNDPVTLRDPTGLLSIEGSLYTKIGGGGKLSITADGISLCLEVGFGVGAGVGVDPFGDLERDQETVFAEAGGGVPGLKGSVAFELDDCGRGGLEGKVCTGPFCLSTSGSATTEGDELKEGVKNLFKGKAGVEAKVGARACRGLRW